MKKEREKRSESVSTSKSSVSTRAFLRSRHELQVESTESPGEEGDIGREENCEGGTRSGGGSEPEKEGSRVTIFGDPPRGASIALPDEDTEKEEENEKGTIVSFIFVTDDPARLIGGVAFSAPTLRVRGERRGDEDLFCDDVASGGQVVNIWTGGKGSDGEAEEEGERGDVRWRGGRRRV